MNSTSFKQYTFPGLQSRTTLQYHGISGLDKANPEI